MKRQLSLAFVSTGVALLLFTSCVSSRKYKTSQAELAKARNDSAQLAQQVASLNGNVKDLQDKNSSLQQNLEASNGKNATTQKSLDYYQDYFKQQQSTLSQVSDDLKGALTNAGISNADIQMVNNTVYVRLDEDELFKKNSMTVTPAGRKALDGLSEVIKNRSNTNVCVAPGDSAVATMASTDMTPEPPKPVHHRRPHPVAKSSGTSGTGAATSGTASSGAATAQNNGEPAHKKVHHHASTEGSMAIYNTPGHHNRAYSMKQGRMVAVANHFLRNGVPRLNVTMQRPPEDNSTDKTIKVIFTPKMEDFNPQNSTSTR
jgi:outer membrane protein OmpA-like peptidoglycan-associated protein